jgi:hypothetical protein
MTIIDVEHTMCLLGCNFDDSEIGMECINGCYEYVRVEERIDECNDAFEQCFDDCDPGVGDPIS